MGGIDVSTSIVIDRPIDEVSAFAANPENAPRWYKNIAAVEWKNATELRVGAQMAFVAKFLGRRLEYTYEVMEWVPHRRLVMRTADGPFPMETTYEWTAQSANATLMKLRNRGTPSGFSVLLRPVMAFAVKRANVQDLQLLKTLLERPTAR
jgi:uncharacterized membrane protein